MEFVSGKDMLMTLPTGYGKSLCYQSLPLVYDEGRTILVAILFQFLLSLDDFVNPQHKHFYVMSLCGQVRNVSVWLRAQLVYVQFTRPSP